MFPILMGLGAAAIALGVMDDTKSEALPTQKPKAKKKAKKDSEETAAQAFARATKESDAKWSAKLKTERGKHSASISALKDAFKNPEPAQDEVLTPDPTPTEE